MATDDDTRIAIHMLAGMVEALAIGTVHMIGGSLAQQMVDQAQTVRDVVGSLPYDPATIEPVTPEELDRVRQRVMDAIASEEPR